MSSDIPSATLKRFAREQRANAVQAETILWRALRDCRCDDAKFRRQTPVGNFIVDFVCFEQRLVIEAVQAMAPPSSWRRTRNETHGCADKLSDLAPTKRTRHRFDRDRG